MLYSVPLFAVAAAQAAVESAVLSDFSTLTAYGSTALRSIQFYSTTGRASSAYYKYLSALETAVSDFESLSTWSPAVWTSYQKVVFQTQQFVSAITLYLAALGTLSDDSDGLYILYRENMILADKVWDLFNEDCTAWGSSYYSSAYYVSAWFSVAASEMSWSTCATGDTACTAYRTFVDHRCVTSTSTTRSTSSASSTSSAAATSSAATATVRCLVRPTGTDAAATSTKFLY